MNERSFKITDKPSVDRIWERKYTQGVCGKNPSYWRIRPYGQYEKRIGVNIENEKINKSRYRMGKGEVTEKTYSGIG